MVKNLKLLRTKNGLSQQALADALEISQQSINRYENHKVEPDIDMLIKMADFFGTSVDFLIGRENIIHSQMESSHHPFLVKFNSLKHSEQACVELMIDTLRKKD